MGREAGRWWVGNERRSHCHSRCPAPFLQHCTRMAVSQTQHPGIPRPDGLGLTCVIGGQACRWRGHADIPTTEADGDVGPSQRLHGHGTCQLNGIGHAQPGVQGHEVLDHDQAGLQAPVPGACKLQGHGDGGIGSPTPGAVVPRQGVVQGQPEQGGAMLGEDGWVVG